MKGKERGITMIQMVITIVMMVLIAAFSIYNARNMIVEAKVSKIYNEMVKVRDGVAGLEIMETVDMKDIGTAVVDFSTYPQLQKFYDASGDPEYYLLDFNTKGDVIADILEIRNIENNYIVNVKNIENIEIFLINGIEISGERYYSDDEILEKYNDIFAGR